MKKVLFTLALIAGTISFTNAQELGVRFGNLSAGNVAIDGIFSTGEFSRIHADVSFGSGGVGIDALWDFLYRPLGGEAFNWYAGAGVFTFIGNDFDFGILGEIGLEYRFKTVPIALGVDWRPYLRFTNNTSFGAEGFGLNVRWVFGSKE
jgi:hypothetical protein